MTIPGAHRAPMLERLYKERRCLNRQKRDLLAKGLHEFCLTKDDSKLTEAKRLTQQINAITAQINFIKEMETKFTALKIESDYTKRDFVAQVYKKTP